MSTRCQIMIEGMKPTIYRHSDGYPDGEYGVIAAIKPFLKKFMALRGDDPEYMLARLLQHLTNLADTHDQEYAKENNYTPMPFLGYGISTGLHGDEDYYYIINPEKRKIGVFTAWDNSPVKTVKF